MPIYKGSTNQGVIYYGSPNTNCLTSVPKNINLSLSNGTLTLKAGSKVYVPNGFDINTSIVGSPIINNGIVSGLTSGNYVKTPNQLNLTTATDWEIVIKYTHLADGSLRGFLWSAYW